MAKKPTREKVSGLAIAALVVGIISFFVGIVPVLGWILVLSALGLGIAVLVSAPSPTGKVFGVIAVALAGTMLLLNIVVWGVLFMLLGSIEVSVPTCIAGEGLDCKDHDRQIDAVHVSLRNAGAEIVIPTQQLFDVEGCEDPIVEVRGGEGQDGELVVGAYERFDVFIRCPTPIPDQADIRFAYQRDGADETAWVSIT